MPRSPILRPRRPALLVIAMAAFGLIAGCDTPSPDKGCEIGTIGRMPLYSLHNVPVVRASLNHHPVLFEVDTGAFNSVLSDRYIDMLGLTLASGYVRVTGAKGTEFQNVTQVDDIGLGGATNTNHGFAVTSSVFATLRPPLPPLVGLLGAEILLASDLVMDMPHHEMQLLDMRRCPLPAPLWKGPLHRVAITSDLDTMKIGLTISIDGSKPIKAVLDTGASRTILPLRFARRLGVTDAMLAQDRSDTQFKAIGSDKVTAWHHRFKSLTLGDFTIYDPEVFILSSDDLDYALFGADFLKEHRLWVTTRGEMYVQHISEIPQETPTLPQ